MTYWFNARHLTSRLAAVWFLIGATICQGQTVTLSIQSEWNLISLPATPIDPDPRVVFQDLIEDGRLRSIWGFSGGTWSFHIETAGVLLPESFNNLTEMVAGRGYFVELTRDPTGAEVAFSYESRPGEADECVSDGWGLIGFDLEGATSVEEVLGERLGSVETIFRFDADTQSYERYNPAAGFSAFERGRGYWIHSLESFCTSASLELVLEPDLDLLPFNAMDPGEEDRDLNRNGFLEDAFEQDTISFGRQLSRKSFILRNRGIGVLSFTVEEAGWWMAPLHPDPLDHPPITSDERGVPLDERWISVSSGDVPWLEVQKTSGTSPFSREDSEVTYRDQEIGLRVDRGESGSEGPLAAGQYLGRIRVNSSAGQRIVFVLLTVPQVTGRYSGTADVRTINGIGHAIGKIAINLTLQQDGQELTGTLDSGETLVFSRDLHFTGTFYEPVNERFVLSSSFILPGKPRADRHSEEQAVDEGLDPSSFTGPASPFLVPLRRDVALVGQVSSPGTLSGEYHEVLWNVLPHPVQLEGTFHLRRSDLDLELCGNGLDDDLDGEVDEDPCSTPSGQVRHPVSGEVLAEFATTTAPVEGISVILTGQHLQVPGVTNAAGEFGYEDLVPGVYRVTASGSGYQSGPRSSSTFELKTDGTISTLDGSPGLSLLVHREYSGEEDPVRILASPDSGQTPLVVQFTGVGSPAIERWVWSFPGGEPASHDGAFPPRVVYEEPGVFPVTLVATIGGESHVATHEIIVGPVGQVQGPGGEVTFIDASEIPLRVAPVSAGVGSSSGGPVEVLGNESSPGAGDATLILIGAIGGHLGGFMTGGPHHGLPGEGVPRHRVLEIGPISAFPAETVR